MGAPLGFGYFLIIPAKFLESQTFTSMGEQSHSATYIPYNRPVVPFAIGSRAGYPPRLRKVYILNPFTYKEVTLQVE